MQIGDHRSRLRSLLCSIAIRIRLEISQSAPDLQFIFIAVSCLCSGYKQFKDAGIPQPSHLMDATVPSVKIAHYADAHGIRCPDGKIGSTLSVQFHGMCSQLFVDGVMNPGRETIHILLRNLGNMPVSIPADHSVGFPVFRLSIFHDILIRRHFPRIHQSGKIALFIRQFHGHIRQKCFPYLSGLLPVDRHLFRSRKIRLYQHFASLFVGSQQFMGIVTFGISDLFYFGPVHQFVKFVCHTPSFLRRHFCCVLFCHL